MSEEAELPIHQTQEEPGKKALGNKLNEVGLNPEYWLPKLQASLGISNAEALQYTEHKDYQKIEHHVRHLWEKRALQKLLNVSDNKLTLEQAREEQCALLKKRQEKAKTILQELTQMQSDGKKRHDDVFRKKEDELRKALEISSEYRVPTGKPLVDMMEKLHKELMLTDNSFAKREDQISDKQVLRNASGGLALEGIYKTTKLEDVLGKREHLVTIPEVFSLYGPEQGPVFQQREFSSSSAESTFTRCMEKLGFSLNCCVKGGFYGFQMEASTVYSKSSESETGHKSHSESSYICTAKYNYIPLASCYFQKDQLRLSAVALQELKCIEQLGSLCKEGDNDVLNSRVERFFNRFGSHANQGPLHFGGIFWWKASSEGFRAEKLDEVRKMTNEALTSHVGASYSGFGLNVAAGVGVSNESSKASFHSTQSETMETQIQVFVTKTGGPVEVDSLAQWKSGLVGNNTTWCVIDRGFQLVPVWDIILHNHKSDFKDVQNLCTSLLEAYKILTNQITSMLSGEQLFLAVDETKIFLQEVKSWEVSSGGEEKLKKLNDFKQKLNEKTKNYSVWIEMCLSDPVLQDFLINIVEQYKGLPGKETAYIKSLMRCLVDPHIYSVDEFPRSSFIMKWIYESEKQQHQDISISGFGQFVEVLEKAKEDIMESMYDAKSTAETKHESKIKATLDVSLSLYSFLKAMRNTKQLEKELLFLYIASCSGYCIQSHAFRYLQGRPEIDFMINEMQTAHTEYLSLREQNVSRAQAFLLLTGLTVGAEGKEVSPEQKKERLTCFTNHMAGSILPEVAEILKEHDKCGDWNILEKDLNALILENYGATVDDLKSQQVVQDLETVWNGVKPISESRDVLRNEPQTAEIFTNQSFLNLIQRLHLQNYYPRKMKMADFHIIDQSALSESPPTTESNLPFYFLQKLLMLDYRARYLVCKDESKGVQPMDKVINSTGKRDESVDILDDFFNDFSNGISDAATVQEAPLHPMDVQMAIFHCADDFMRQYISTKLSFCQFALPLLVPNPCKSQLEFPLWSFRLVKKKWKSKTDEKKDTDTKKCKDKSITEAQTPLVSFIRFGNSSSSKSQILNTLLSKQKHSIFFHRHCRGSSKDCLLMDGVVEIAWYCPGGKDDDSFDECIAFTNLHGDARDHEKQVTFLHEISAVNVILLSDQDHNEKGKDILRNVLKSNKPLICLCADKDHIAVDKSGTKVKIAIKNRNEAELIGELTTTMKRLLKVSNTRCSLEECENTARRHGFLVDENMDDCREGKAMAQALLSVLKENNLSDMKNTFLPLQGELWHQWCKKDKELTRLQDKMNKSIEQQKSDIESKKHSIRCDQLKRAFPLNDLMRSFLQILQSSSHSKKMYFLQWFKMFMDDLSSDNLSILHQKYHDLWSNMLAEKQTGKRNDLVKALQCDLDKLSNEINDSTFGLEHLLRELGQIYEALDSLPKKDKSFYGLPQIAADMMVSGYPIELMDGDAAHVPLKWIDAVLDKLIEKLGDKKLFVLSVLGIQSTGKSTLLNAMFGLQFAVSAGRCTRGAFMQLIKVDEKLRSDFNFDFVLVIDTEGLRALELANKASRSHDNELATFVIGLGNVTLINIFGENPCEMQDILQIAVQAFLRMKQVRLTPSCLFVHQNVGEITAKEKNMEGRRRLQEKLDEMTLTAAQQERCDVTCFNDVIKFDVNTHIHYFAHLWEGDGPMAPPNPSYSQNIQELKSIILMTAKRDSQSSMLRISDLKLRINDLWGALLNENFVFSFKNSLEIATYNRLEVMYGSWTWQLREHLLKLQNQLNIKIENNEIQNVDRTSIDGQVREKYDTIVKSMNKFFDEDKDAEMLIQWRGNTENRLNIVQDDLIVRTITMSKELIRLKNSKSKFDQMKSDYEIQLFTKSKQMALNFKGKELGEVELRENFNILWNKWLTEVVSTAPPPERPNVNTDMQNILLEQFKNESDLVNRIKDSATWVNFVTEFSKHISTKTKWGGWKNESLNKNEKVKIKQVTESLEQHVINYIEVKEQQRKDYRSIYFHEILNIIKEHIESIFEGTKFKFKTEYKVDVSLYLCHMAATRFKQMAELFQKANDPCIHLESKREHFFHTFKISCEGTKRIATFADFLCDKLKVAIHQGVYDKAAIDISGQMRCDYPAFNGNRSKLENHILISLAEEQNFQKYMEYINHPKKAFQHFIKTRVNSYCLDNNKTKLNNSLNIALDSFQRCVLKAIDESTKVVKDKDDDVSAWLDDFCRSTGDQVNLPRSELRDVDHLEVTDIDFLKEAMTKALDTVVNSLQQDFEKVNLKAFRIKPHEILCEHLAGCWVQCPCCTAICTNTVLGHDGDHSVQFHRPQAVSGTAWYNTNDLCIDICSSLVASDCSLVLSDAKRIPYKRYREAGPRYACWSITPDTSVQSYWKWFVNHFRLDLATHFGKKFSGRGTIPSQWEHIKKETAIQELQKQI